MIGFWASKADEMLDGYSGTPPFNHDPVTAAKQLGFSVTAASGPIAQTSGDTNAATVAAKNAHTILCFGGIDNSVEKESNDRTNIACPGFQLAQIKALAALNKPAVVIKMGTHVDDTPLLSMPNVRAILWAGYPGQDGRTAVINVLLGRPAPAGRLPITMYPSSYTQDAPMANMALRPSSSYLGRTYRWYDKAVFPFGQGLHYTILSAVLGGPSISASFSIQSLVSSCNETTYLDRCQFTSLPLSVANTGSGSDRTSDYVALTFLAGTYGPAPHPRKTLAAYTRLFNITAGQTQTSELKWTLGHLARVGANGNRVLYPGNYTVLLDEPAIANLTFSLTGSGAVLDKWPQPK